MSINEERKIDRESEDYSVDNAVEGAYARFISGNGKGKDVHDAKFGGDEEVSAGMFKKRVAEVAFIEFKKSLGKDEVFKFVGLERLLNGQYSQAVKDLEGGNLSPKEKDKPMPSMLEAQRTLEKKLTLDQLEVIAGMENPVFVMKPKTTYKRFEDDLKKMTDMRRPNSREKVWEKREEEAGVSEVITGWEVGFVDGVKTLDGEGGRLDNLIKKWESSNLVNKGAKLLTPNEFMLLSMRMISTKKRIDPRRWAVLRQEGSDNIVEDDGCISGGDLKKKSFALLTYKPERSFNDADFRYGVMVDVA